MMPITIFHAQTRPQPLVNVSDCNIHIRDSMVMSYSNCTIIFCNNIVLQSKKHARTP